MEKGKEDFKKLESTHLEYEGDGGGSDPYKIVTQVIFSKNEISSKQGRREVIREIVALFGKRDHFVGMELRPLHKIGSNSLFNEPSMSPPTFFIA